MASHRSIAHQGHRGTTMHSTLELEELLEVRLHGRHHDQCHWSEHTMHCQLQRCKEGPSRESWYLAVVVALQRSVVAQLQCTVAVRTAEATPVRKGPKAVRARIRPRDWVVVEERTCGRSSCRRPFAPQGRPSCCRHSSWACRRSSSCFTLRNSQMLISEKESNQLINSRGAVPSGRTVRR